MTAPMLFALLLVFCAGLGLGRLRHVARAGQRASAAEARLTALHDNERLLRQSLGAVSEDAALTTDAGLLEYAFGRNVILATSTTLIALLRTVAYGWRQEALFKDVATIQQLGRELYARLGTTGGHLDRLGAQLGKAVDSFNQTVASVESRVMVTARRLHELEIGDREVPAIQNIESWPRSAGFSDINE